MLKNLRFYYRFLLILVTKKYKQIFIGLFVLVVALVVARFLFGSIVPDLYEGISLRISKPRYNEGIVGSVDILNPVYSKKLAEKEINSLVFRGLTKLSADGSVVPDMAEDFSRESDTKYVFRLKKDLYWHDGRMITVDDVIHTIDLSQKPNPPSEYAANFEDVAIVKIDDYTLEFNLKEPFAPFLLNTTMGIVPKHVSLEEYKPIGSGEFEVSTISDERVILESDSLILVFKIYKTKEEAILALKLGEIDSLGGLSFFEIDEFRFWSNLNIYSSDLQQRQVVAFFNLRDDQLKIKEFRQALSYAVPKELIAQVLPGLNLKISETSLPLNSWANEGYTDLFKYSSKNSEEIFEKLGWQKEGGVRLKKNKEMELEVTTSNEEELIKVAEAIEESWESIGAKVEIRKVDTKDLIERVIPERDFEVLLSIQQISTDPDQYSIWHSSQTNDANITSIESARIDKILEDGRKTFNKRKRKKTYDTFNRILADESPAIFLYYPKYFWLVNKKVENVEPVGLIQTSDRFKNTNDWNYRSGWLF
jgi:peptide/nickel transport system substrate-binding protein